MTIQQAFLRPIETNSDMDDFTYSVDGSPYTVALRDGVEASIFTLVYHINDNLDDSAFMYLDSAFKVVLGHATKDVGITINDTSRLLGWVATVAETQVTETATNTPLFCWIPRDGSRSADKGVWGKPQQERFKGTLGSTGGKFGVTLPAKYQRAFSYSMQNASNTLQTYNATEYTITAVDYYQEAERCFMQVFEDANTVDLTYTDSSNVNPTGLYYIHEAYDYLGSSPTTAIPATMDEGGIYFDSSDTYIYCQIKGDIMEPTPSLRNSKDYFDFAFTLAADDTPATVAWIT